MKTRELYASKTIQETTLVDSSHGLIRNEGRMLRYTRPTGWSVQPFLRAGDFTSLVKTGSPTYPFVLNTLHPFTSNRKGSIWARAPSHEGVSRVCMASSGAILDRFRLTARFLTMWSTWNPFVSDQQAPSPFRSMVADDGLPRCLLASQMCRISYYTSTTLAPDSVATPHVTCYRAFFCSCDSKSLDG